MLRRRFFYDEKGTPSLDIRIQAQDHPAVDLTGIVDSGASTTVLSRQHANELGITPDDLLEAGTALTASDDRVPCWTATIPIRAQVLWEPARGDLVPWGPVFSLKAVFFEHATPLWGSDDFLATFRTHLGRDVDPPWFELIYQPDD